MAYRGILFALLALLTVGVVVAVLPWEHGRWSARDAYAQGSPPVEVRIAAQRLESGNTEFALQIIDQATGQASARLLPNPRFLSGATAPGSWRHSGPVEIAGAYILRVSARFLEDGRIEFAMQQLEADNAWSERILPHQRLFLAYPPIGKWLVSSDVAFPQATHVPVTNAQGRYSYTGHYNSKVFRGIIGSYLRNYSLSGDVQISLLCQYGLNLSLLSLPKFDANPVDVTLTFPNGMASTSAWRRYDSTILQSPDPWADFNRLQQAKSVTVTIPGLLSEAREFDLTDMFTTPIQGNLEHCGNYASGNIRELPAPFASHEGGSLTTFNGAASEARWSRAREPGSLSHVVLTERLLQFHDGGEVGDRFSLSLYMSCGRRGPIVQLSGAALDDAIDRAKGGRPRVQWSLDGEPIRVLPWRLGQGVMYPQDARSFLATVRQGTYLQVGLDPEGKETLAFDMSALFGSSAQHSFDECVEHPVRTEPLPFNDSGWGGSGVPGLEYRIGSGRNEGLSWWTELVLNEQSVWSGEPSAHQEMRISCGLDGIAIQVKNVGTGQPVFLRGWPAAVEVTWRTEADADTESWDVWDLEFYKRGFALSPPDDREFFERIHGADSLTISVPTEPHPVTLSFVLGEIGIWDTPAAINLNACDHGGTEPD